MWTEGEKGREGVDRLGREKGWGSRKSFFCDFCVLNSHFADYVWVDEIKLPLN